MKPTPAGVERVAGERLDAQQEHAEDGEGD